LPTYAGSRGATRSETASGALIDHAIKGRRLVYAPGRTSIVIELKPRLSARSASALMTVTWSR
jgi:hypothetical protein